MRIEPVYLVAPRSRSMPTRRAFLCIGAAFAGGAVLGTACGYSLGKAAAEADAAADRAPPPTGDEDLDELRRLAVEAPIEELVEQRLVFVTMLNRHYASDPVLWRGVVRLGDALLGDPAFPDRRRFARFLQQTIESCKPAAGHDWASLVDRLRKVDR